MLSNRHYFLLAALLCLPQAALAVTIHRCEAPDGSITFTTLSCNAGEDFSMQEVRTSMPGTSMALLPEADARDRTSATGKMQLTIIGQTEDRCGNQLTAKERREAIIGQRIVAGMTQQDVESALGKPDKITIRNSATSYRYDAKRGRNAQIAFDERGCTKGKAKSQTAKSPL
ncbi:MAG: cell envelope protein SmpA [Pseudomonas mandelii]